VLKKIQESKCLLEQDLHQYPDHMKKSAGILVYRNSARGIEVLLVHPGGPLWKNKDEGAWTIPKGEFTDEETPLDAGNREFTEETGIALYGDFIELTPIQQKGGKWVYASALEFDLDASSVVSNTFEMEWPPKSGKLQRFPEIDRAAWFPVAAAKTKMIPAQTALLDELVMKIAGNACRKGPDVKE
jgi:predicted NUDIX family NTP pyrophosphohydrolase